MAPADPLSELRERVHAAQAAAERLADEAREHAAELPRPDARDELDALVALLRALRELVPPELQQQVTDLIRQVLLLVRAVLDLAIERLETGRGGEPDVQDIPIA
jgi:hypothetical protein